VRNLGWDSCPTAHPPCPTDAPGDLPHGWPHHATRMRNLYCHRDRVLLPARQPASRALLRSQGGPHGGAWLAPQAMQLARRRRPRLPLPLCPNRCGPRPGCGQRVDVYGDHALACPRTGLLARRAIIVERAWVRVAREAVKGPKGKSSLSILQQWLAHTTAPGVPSDNHRQLDLGRDVLRRNPRRLAAVECRGPALVARPAPGLVAKSDQAACRCAREPRAGGRSCRAVGSFSLSPATRGTAATQARLVEKKVFSAKVCLPRASMGWPQNGTR